MEINIDKELKDNERYQELIGGLNSLNEEIAKLTHLRDETDRERLLIEKNEESKKRQII